MKTKLTLTVDEELVPRAKKYARERGVSLSSLIESVLQRMTESDDTISFVERWRGRMVLADLDDERYRGLKDKYG